EQGGLCGQGLKPGSPWGRASIDVRRTRYAIHGHQRTSPVISHRAQTCGERVDVGLKASETWPLTAAGSPRRAWGRGWAADPARGPGVPEAGTTGVGLR